MTVLLFCCCYQQHVTGNRAEFPEEVPEEVSMAEEPHDFKTSLLGCFMPGSYCLFGFFCWRCRHADTLSAVGKANFNITIFAMILIEIAASTASVFTVTEGFGKELDEPGVLNEESTLIAELDTL